MKFTPALFAGLLGICSCACAQTSDFAGDVTDVRVIRQVEQQPGASLLWEPSIAQWNAKHLVAVFGAGIPGKTDMGDILASVSSNDGDSWSEPVAVFDHKQFYGEMQFAYANPVLYKAPGQDVMWCYAMRCPMNYPDSEDSRLVAAFSADSGRSWTHVEPAMFYNGPLITVSGNLTRIVENGQPRYLMPVHRNTRRHDPLGTRDLFVLSSASLLEWHLAGYVPQETIGAVFLQEGNIAVEPGGELKMVMRTADGKKEGKAVDPPRAFSSVSKDGGRTWSVAQPEPDLWNTSAKEFFGLAANGTHLYVYNDGPAKNRMALRYKLQPPGGSWSAEKTFFDAEIHNSYPSLTEVAPNEFRAVWDSGTKERNRTEIHFGKFHVPSAALR
ncbi:MAG TPA: sialidase family protein [Verrucomicrobiae bacterium]|jgi:hypothetical protein|nr:sialidase family protein [Verrucomicrobiae bacterium]